MLENLEYGLNIYQQHEIVFLEILDMGLISIKKHEMEILYWIRDQYLSKTMHWTIDIGYGINIYPKNMTWTFSTMGSISKIFKKTWNQNLVSSIKGTWTCGLYFQFSIKGKLNMSTLFLFSIKGILTTLNIPIPTPAPAPLLVDTSDLGGHEWSWAARVAK